MQTLVVVGGRMPREMRSLDTDTITNEEWATGSGLDFLPENLIAL